MTLCTHGLKKQLRKEDYLVLFCLFLQMYSSHTFSTEFLGFARFAGFVHFEAELYSPRHFSALMFCDEDSVIL